MPALVCLHKVPGVIAAPSLHAASDDSYSSELTIRRRSVSAVIRDNICLLVMYIHGLFVKMFAQNFAARTGAHGWVTLQSLGLLLLGGEWTQAAASDCDRRLAYSMLQPRSAIAYVCYNSHRYEHVDNQGRA